MNNSQVVIKSTFVSRSSRHRYIYSVGFFLPFYHFNAEFIHQNENCRNLWGVVNFALQKDNK